MCPVDSIRDAGCVPVLVGSKGCDSCDHLIVCSSLFDFVSSEVMGVSVLCVCVEVYECSV